MPDEQRENLCDALGRHFEDREADCLAGIFTICLDKDITPYEDLASVCQDVDDVLLTAFDERALLPVSPKAASAWEERSLLLRPGEHFFIPSVTRFLVRHALWSGRLNTDQALSGALDVSPAVQVQLLIRLVRQIMDHSRSRRFEAGLMLPLAKAMHLQADLHETIDLLVSAGVISPCKGASLTSGLSWFEINPCLFWEASPRFSPPPP